MPQRSVNVNELCVSWTVEKSTFTITVANFTVSPKEFRFFHCSHPSSSHPWDGYSFVSYRWEVINNREVTASRGFCVMTRVCKIRRVRMAARAMSRERSIPFQASNRDINFSCVHFWTRQAFVAYTLCAKLLSRTLLDAHSFLGMSTSGRDKRLLENIVSDPELGIWDRIDELGEIDLFVRHV